MKSLPAPPTSRSCCVVGWPEGLKSPQITSPNGPAWIVSLPLPPSSSLWPPLGDTTLPPSGQSAPGTDEQATNSLWQGPVAWTESHEYVGSVPANGSWPGRASSG